MLLSDAFTFSVAETTESHVTYPLVQTHGSIPGPMLDKLGIDERLLRLSVGLENAEDLIADLEQAIG